MTDLPFTVRFWGVRGSVPCPGADMLRYGGNTSCVEMRCGPHVLVFDAGTGMKNLGDTLVGADQKLNVFLSHTHLDHISGFPFFKPAYGKGNTIKIWAGHLFPSHNIREVLSRMMEQPFFPVSVGILAAWMEFVDFRPGGPVLEPVADVKIKTVLLNHPNGATGYRVEYGGKSVCYVTDTEHVPGKPDKNVLELIDGCDLFIYDSTYTDEEFPNFVGWGHSTWQEGARLAKAAGAKRFVAFHHEPSHNDGFLDNVAGELSILSPNAVIAKEGMILTP